ncbi:hypothetical protein B0O99DRAFT_690064 [Bisporella sp. PMI_857]|nr:hypothetical protein B0O99DRAFT_690064 [Bisporella sp. PMI_857]
MPITNTERVPTLRPLAGGRAEYGIRNVTPTTHLQTLRHPLKKAPSGTAIPKDISGIPLTTTGAYASPALHNSSDTFLRRLRRDINHIDDPSYGHSPLSEVESEAEFNRAKVWSNNMKLYDLGFMEEDAGQHTHEMQLEWEIKLGEEVDNLMSTQQAIGSDGRMMDRGWQPEDVDDIKMHLELEAACAEILSPKPVEKTSFIYAPVFDDDDGDSDEEDSITEEEEEEEEDSADEDLRSPVFSPIPIECPHISSDEATIVETSGLDTKFSSLLMACGAILLASTMPQEIVVLIVLYLLSLLNSQDDDPPLVQIDGKTIEERTGENTTEIANGKELENDIQSAEECLEHNTSEYVKEQTSNHIRHSRSSSIESIIDPVFDDAEYSRSTSPDTDQEDIECRDIAAETAVSQIVEIGEYLGSQGLVHEHSVKPEIDVIEPITNRSNISVSLPSQLMQDKDSELRVNALVSKSLNDTSLASDLSAPSTCGNRIDWAQEVEDEYGPVRAFSSQVDGSINESSFIEMAWIRTPLSDIEEEDEDDLHPFIESLDKEADFVSEPHVSSSPSKDARFVSDFDWSVDADEEYEKGRLPAYNVGLQSPEHNDATFPAPEEEDHATSSSIQQDNNMLAYLRWGPTPAKARWNKLVWDLSGIRQFLLPPDARCGTLDTAAIRENEYRASAEHTQDGAIRFETLQYIVSLFYNIAEQGLVPAEDPVVDRSRYVQSNPSSNGPTEVTFVGRLKEALFYNDVLNNEGQWQWVQFAVNEMQENEYLRKIENAISPYIQQYVTLPRSVLLEKALHDGWNRGTLYKEDYKPRVKAAQKCKHEIDDDRMQAVEDAIQDAFPIYNAYQKDRWYREQESSWYDSQVS